MLATILVTALAPLVGAESAPAQVVELDEWAEQNPATSPPVTAYGAAAALDGEVVLFTGTETWAWNGTTGTWAEESPLMSPSARSEASAATHLPSGHMVLFGGFSGSVTNDFDETWLWNGATWAEADPLTHPSERSGAAMAYDAARGQVVLFGGWDGAPLDDTWLWNGATWVEADPAHRPPKRDDAVMAYDAARAEVVLYGGYDENDVFVTETWVWNGLDWTERVPGTTAPSGRVHAMAASHPGAGGVVLFGGRDSSGAKLNDAWAWDGTDWAVLDLGTPPSIRQGGRLVHDPAGAELVLFGGDNGASFLDDTWTLRLAVARGAGYPSNDCDGPEAEGVGPIQSGTAYAKLLTRPDPNDADTTWVCFAADGGSGTGHVGGKVIVDASSVPVDDEQQACHANGTPPFPRHVEGMIGPDDTPFHLDVVLVEEEGELGNEVWVCALAGETAKRVVLPADALRFVPDQLDHADPPTTTTSSTTTTSTTTSTTTTSTTMPRPPAGQASRYCVDNGGDEQINEPAGGGRVWAYTLEEETVAHLCVRFQTGPPGGDAGTFAGGHLRVDAVGQQAVVVEERDDFTTDPNYAPSGPCDVNVINITSDPELIIKVRHPVHGSPAFVCIRADETSRRFRIDGAKADTLVDLDLDMA